MPVRRLTRARAEARLAGVCAGIANYFDVDVVLVRAAWVVFSIVPGAIIGGLLAYLAAWIVMPEGSGVEVTPSGRRLVRSDTDSRIAGVCGGLAEYFDVDATPIRLLWLIGSILFGAIIGGVIAYLLAWIIIPRRSDVVLVTPAPASPSTS